MKFSCNVLFGFGVRVIPAGSSEALGFQEDCEAPQRHRRCRFCSAHLSFWGRGHSILVGTVLSLTVLYGPQCPAAGEAPPPSVPGFPSPPLFCPGRSSSGHPDPSTAAAVSGCLHV